MHDDKSTSELISRSLSGSLDEAEQQAMVKRVAEDDQSRHFANLSRLIQDSLSDFARRTESGDESVAQGLSTDAAARMKTAIQEESARLTGIHQGATVTPADTGLLESTPVETTQRKMNSRFSLIKQLGQGGLGTVWLAKDELLKRTVALKEMNPEAAEFPRAWERFHREAEITGHLEHPNVVPMYQFGTDTETGAPFYAMRFVGKRTLVEAIEEYHDRRHAEEDVTMDLHRLLTAFSGVCQAIAYAHSRGVVHRDLKPENVALDSFGQVIVLDWGLAKVSEEHDVESLLSGDHVQTDSALGKTMAGEVLGTPLYMAPEQASGDLDHVDARTDVYGLGAILFAMLTGQAPHQRHNPEGGQLKVPELLQKISTDPTPNPRDILADVPAALAQICVRAMHFKPHSRFQTATEVSDAIQQWIAGRGQRRQNYANSRGEGREIRTSLQSAVRDLERNVRFMSSLPPIQGIINAVNERPGDELSVWRKRLRVIYEGLLQTNSDFSSVAFARVTDGKFHEVIRLERQRSDTSAIRSIPTSRLISGDLTSCMQTTLDNNPGEVHVALSSECPIERRTSAGTRMAAGVPVFDEETEDLFGFVIIESCIEGLMERAVRSRLTSVEQLIVLDNDCHVLLEFDGDGSRIRENEGQPMSDVTENWQPILQGLKSRGEYIDNHDHAVYATRVDLVPGKYSLAIAMCLEDH